MKNILNLLVYIIKNVKTNDFHNVFKVMYWSEMEHLSKYGCSIYNDNFKSFPKGPVPDTVYSMISAVKNDFADNMVKSYIKVYNSYNLEALQEPDLDYISETEIECITNAIKKSDALTFNQRAELSHDTAWKKGKKEEFISKIDMAAVGGANSEVLKYLSNYYS